MNSNLSIEGKFEVETLNKSLLLFKAYHSRFVRHKIFLGCSNLMDSFFGSLAHSASLGGVKGRKR